MTADFDRSGEFEVIKKIFSPLSMSAPGAFGLTDDAAVMSVEAGFELVITKDAMVAGVHFLEDDKPENIARKLLRTNLSDIAAMGAKPLSYLLATAWTDDCNQDWIARFANGLVLDQKKYGVSLLGGDTVKTPGPLTLSLTLIGKVPSGQSLRRNGAKVGDLLCVSGTIGDAALGLMVARQELKSISEINAKFLLNRYLLPDPRVSLGPALVGLANGCLDISDGLLADIGHIVAQSKTGAIIHRSEIPLSKAAIAAVDMRPELWKQILGGGDDYELAFTLPRKNLTETLKKAESQGVKVTVIGEITHEPEMKILDDDGIELQVNSTGWAHF